MNPHGRGKFCDRDDCACFAFSFASSPHAAEFDIKRNNKVTPRQVTKSSKKKYWFTCNNCEHSFESALSNITSGCWCPFPPCCKTPKQLCEKEDCQHCWNASFASSPHAAEFDIERNKVTPRQVTKSSSNKYWFTCNNCEHSFESALSNITNNGNWCPFPPCCKTPKQFCENKDCQHCWNASFASSPHAAEFDIERNKVTPRQVTKSSNNKYWFACNDCHHSFQSALNNITSSGRWCPFPPCCTSTQKLCKEEDCQHCWNASFASSPYAAEFDIERNKVTPRQVTKSSSNKYWFTCNNCEHSFESALSNITSGCWCPFPPCCKTPKQLCENKDCQHCWNASFASSPHAAEFDIKINIVTPRQVTKSSSNKYWFACNDCHHSFQSALSSITSGRWCPFPPCCTSTQKLCENKDCQHCWNASFASSPHAAEFDIERNNKVTPRQVTKSSHKKYWFACNDCHHSFQSALSSITNGQWCPFPPCCTSTQKMCEKEDCQHCWNASFASSPHAAEFDIKINIVTPRQVPKSSGNKYWFTCNNCEHSFESALSNITSGCWCPFPPCCTITQKLCKEEDCQHCWNASFASSPHAAEFDIERNNKVTPRQVPKSSNKIYWFTCNNCEHSFESALNNITSGGQWCPFPPCCTMTKKLCKEEDCQHCWNASFASSPHAAEFDIERNKMTPRQVTKSSSNKYWFACNDCHHSFQSALYHITSGQWCPFPPCCKTPKQLCENKDCQHCWNVSFASSSHAAEFDIKRNKVTPRQVTKSSNKIYWFTCNNCEHSFESALSNITSGHWCPSCKNKTEKKVFQHVRDMYPDTRHGFRADWCRNPQTGRYLPFDILLEAEKKIIVEVDGMQHFEVVKKWKSCPEKQLQRDTYKTIQALKHGYSMVRICQRSVCSSWDWVAALEAAIHDCLSCDKHIEVYVAEDLAQYDGHQVSITEDALQDIDTDDIELLSGMSDTSSEDADPKYNKIDELILVS